MNLDLVRKSVIENANEVGAFIRQEQQNFDKAKTEQKDGFNNLVSYVDKKAEKLIVNALKKYCPDPEFWEKKEPTSNLKMNMSGSLTHWMAPQTSFTAFLSLR